MIRNFLGAVVAGSLILPVPADAGSAVGKTNAGGKYVHYGRTNPVASTSIAVSAANFILIPVVSTLIPVTQRGGA